LPAAIVDKATRAGQRVVVGTLGTLAAEARAAQLSGPAVIIVGTVVTLRDKLDWRPHSQPHSSAEGDRSPAASEKDRER
jgi:siroheme synthase